MPNLVEISLVALEKIRKMLKVFTTTATGNGEILIRNFVSGDLNNYKKLTVQNGIKKQFKTRQGDTGLQYPFSTPHQLVVPRVPRL